MSEAKWLAGSERQGGSDMLSDLSLPSMLQRSRQTAGRIGGRGRRWKVLARGGERGAAVLCQAERLRWYR